jgi:transcription elongation factor Elf1
VRGSAAIMTTRPKRKDKSKEKEITFKCRFCEESKLLDEMVVLTRYFPPVIACRDCEKKLG